MSRALRRRYGHARTSEKDAQRWSANSRKWWARAERRAPAELAAYRAARAHKSIKARSAALKKLKEAMA